MIVAHPRRGTIILMTTDTDRDPLDVLLLYSYRFKIEIGFRHAIHVVGAYASGMRTVVTDRSASVMTQNFSPAFER